jgi:hypothetical protein
MALAIKYTRFVPIYPNGYFIQWTISDFNPNLDGSYEFEVYVSGSPSGPWESVSGVLVDTYSFFDKNTQPAGTIYKNYRRVNTFAINRTPYYKTVVRAPDGTIAETVDDTDPVLDFKQAQYWRKGDYNFRKSLLVNGVPVAVIKKRRWGKRCPRCIDPVTKVNLRAACKVCFASGFLPGYFNPQHLHIKRGAPQSSSQLTPEGRKDFNGVTVHVPYTPQLDQGDLVVFLRDNRRFMVDQQSETQITTVTLHQVCKLNELPRDHVCFKIPVDPTNINPIL